VFEIAAARTLVDSPDTPIARVPLAASNSRRVNVILAVLCCWLGMIKTI
jgi:hypothetical protein